ncbi:MAG: hypothetical protein DA329_09015 [Candidatus Nitrosocosmicus sp.]|jgi:uncharacterized membrane protein|nr:hypothetical protein [Candidatus Nitrosocosmicus sp.]
MVNIYGISKFHMKIFTDAVFGVAITILAVELQVPHLDSNSLVSSEEFGEIATTFISYITTFVIIGIYWITYHAVFNPITRTTDLMIWMNLSFLMFIAIIPFSIRLMNEYNNQHSFIFYSIIQIMTGLILFLMWQHVIRKNTLVNSQRENLTQLNPEVIRLTYYRTIIIPIAYTISIVFSFINPNIVSIFPLIIITPVSIFLRWKYKDHSDLHAHEV